MQLPLAGNIRELQSVLKQAALAFDWPEPDPRIPALAPGRSRHGRRGGPLWRRIGASGIIYPAPAPGRQQ